MSLKIAFIMDPITHVNPVKDSTIAMVEAAQNRGWQSYYVPMQGLYFADGKVMVQAYGLQLCLDQSPWYKISPLPALPLADFNVAMMRKDPPFDMNYIYATYLLELSEAEGVVVINRPQSIRDANEKLFTLQFPQCTTPVSVTSQATEIKHFLQKHGDIILKPLDGMGGTSIFRVTQSDPNINVIIETLTQFGTIPIMAQKFIPDISQGDKRILMIDGQAVPFALARIPTKGETRGNLAAGGTGKVQVLTEKDRWIADQVGPTLKAKGLIFVGLDVIGDYLTEINVTSPTCIREITAESKVPIADQLMDVIQKRWLQQVDK